jgi:hypothetical protein
MSKDMEKTEYTIKQVGNRYYPIIIDREAGGFAGAHPADSWTLSPCLFHHDATLPHYRLLHVKTNVTSQQLMDLFHPRLGDVRVM